MRYLRHLSNRNPAHVGLSVHSGILQHESTLHAGYDIGDCASQGAQQLALELRIHAPQFYRQMITYEKLVDYLRYTLLHPHEENHTAWSNDAEHLINYLQISERIEDDALLYGHSAGLLQKLLWGVYERLRTIERMTGAYPDPGLPQTRTGPAASRDPTIFTSARRRTCLDDFVFGHCDPWLQIQYVWATLSLQWRTKIMSVIGGE